MAYTKKELKNYLKDLLKGKSEITDVSFDFQSGHMASDARLRIILTSNKIEHWKVPKGTPVDDTEEKRVAKVQILEFSSERLSTFIQELVKMKIWDLENCTDRALPGTTLLTFSIKDNENLLFTQEIWENCRNDDKRTKDLLRTIAANIPLDLTPP